jgi:hypothetical protein
MKINRQTVYNKHSGHCAYCGKPITLKEMQVDHIHPKTLAHHLRGIMDINDPTNLNPSCRSCNHYKRALTLDEFRNIWLGGLCKRLSNLYTVKVGMDYGIVVLKEWDRKFYFEKIGE